MWQMQSLIDSPTTTSGKPLTASDSIACFRLSLAACDSPYILPNSPSTTVAPTVNPKYQVNKISKNVRFYKKYRVLLMVIIIQLSGYQITQTIFVQRSNGKKEHITFCKVSDRTSR